MPHRCGTLSLHHHRPAGEAHARFPTGPLRQLQLSRLHHRPGRGNPGNRRPTTAVTPRSRMRFETSKYNMGLNHLPSGHFAANGAWLAVQVLAHNLARRTVRHRAGRAGGDHQDPPATVLLYRRDGSPTRRAASPCICPSAGPGQPSSVAPSLDCEPCHFRPDGACLPLTPPSSQLNVSANSRHPGPRAPLAVSLARRLAHHSHCRPPSAPPKAPADRRQPPVYPNSSPDHRACNSLTPLPLSSRRPSVSIGGFGLEQAALAVDPLAGRLIPTNLLRL